MEIIQETWYNQVSPSKRRGLSWSQRDWKCDKAYKEGLGDTDLPLGRVKGFQPTTSKTVGLQSYYCKEMKLANNPRDLRSVLVLVWFGFFLLIKTPDEDTAGQQLDFGLTDLSRGLRLPWKARHVRVLSPWACGNLLHNNTKPICSPYMTLPLLPPSSSLSDHLLQNCTPKGWINLHRHEQGMRLSLSTHVVQHYK